MILLITLILTACTSVVDSTIPLSKTFKTNTEFIVLKTPNWKASDALYNQKLGSYAIQNSKTTGQKLNEELTGMRREGGFLNYLLFDDNLHHIVKEFNVEGTQRFSFNLLKDKVVKTTSKCEIFSQTSRTQTETGKVIRVGIRDNVNFDDREKTFLVCSINQGNEHWGLTLKSYKDEPLVVKLSSKNASYTIKDISLHYDILSNGEQKSVPPWMSLHSGLEFYKANHQVSALSFLKKSKIWIKNSLSTDEKALLLSVNYSLMMFNWLDGVWRK